MSLLLRMPTARAWEARIVSWWLNPLLDGGVVGMGPYYIVRIGPDTPVAFNITAECSAVVLIAPLLMIGSIFIFSRRVRWIRGFAGIASMLAVVMVTNQLRLALIAWATLRWGMSPGYEVSHRLVGSLLGIAGFIAGVIVLILVSGLGPSRGRAGKGRT